MPGRPQGYVPTVLDGMKSPVREVEVQPNDLPVSFPEEIDTNGSTRSN